MRGGYAEALRRGASIEIRALDRPVNGQDWAEASQLNGEKA